VCKNRLKKLSVINYPLSVKNSREAPTQLFNFSLSAINYQLSVFLCHAHFERGRSRAGGGGNVDFMRERAIPETWHAVCIILRQFQFLIIH